MKNIKYPIWVYKVFKVVYFDKSSLFNDGYINFPSLLDKGSRIIWYFLTRPLAHDGP